MVRSLRDAPAECDRPLLANGSAPGYSRRMSIADAPAGFDTLAATRDLEAAGIERRHAEAVVAVVRASRAGLATKADIDNLEARLNGRFAEQGAQIDGRFAEQDARIDGRFAEQDARIDGRFAEFEARVLKVAISIVLAQTALTFALLKLLGAP